MSAGDNPDSKSSPPDEAAIGRPGDWSERRYEQPGEAPAESVVRKPGEQVTPHAPVSTPVTQEDYHAPDQGT